MKRPAWMFGIAALLCILHLVARVAGLAEHASALAGMPLSPASLVLGPLHVVLYLLLVVVAPILVIAGTIDTVIQLRFGRSGERSEAPVEPLPDT